MAEPALISDGLGAGLIAAIATTGAGLVAFLKWAVNQWLSERKQERSEMLADRKEERTDRAKDREVQVEMQLSVAALVERDRIREERRRRESGMTPTQRVPSGEFDAFEDTGIRSIKERLRATATTSQRSTQTPPKGIRNTPNEDR